MDNAAAMFLGGTSGLTEQAFGRRGKERRMSGNGRVVEILNSEEPQVTQTCEGLEYTRASTSHIEAFSDGAQSLFRDNRIKPNTSQTFGPTS